MNSSVSVALLVRMRLLIEVRMEHTHLLLSSYISFSINNEFIDVCTRRYVSRTSEISASLLWSSVLLQHSTVHESQGYCR